MTGRATGAWNLIRICPVHGVNEGIGRMSMRCDIRAIGGATTAGSAALPRPGQTCCPAALLITLLLTSP